MSAAQKLGTVLRRIRDESIAVKKDGLGQAAKTNEVVEAANAPTASYPARKSRSVPPPSELARVPTSNAYCHSQLCLEIKYNLPYYLRKSDLMRYLREQHQLWWQRYTVLYDRAAFSYKTDKTDSGWDYTDAAKEMLSRCKLHDSLFTQVLKIDLTHVDDFGDYLALVFLEINKLKSAFPEARSSRAVFRQAARHALDFVLRQAPEGWAGETHAFSIPDDPEPS